MMVDLKVMAYFKLSLSTHNWDRAFYFISDLQTGSVPSPANCNKLLPLPI